MPAPSFATRKPIYARAWAEMEIDPGHTPIIDKAAKRLFEGKARYQSVEKVTGVPWFAIACLHNRECNGNWKGVLHNGELIVGTGRKTKLVPAGKGPFATWEAAAIDALADRPIIDSPERLAYYAEKFNGFGYANKGIASPYLWSFSNIYRGGKYTSDGHFDPHAVDGQIGVMPLLRRMMALDPSIRFGGVPDVPAPLPIPVQPTPPKVVPVAGGIIVVIAAALAGFWHQVVAFLDWLWPFN